MSIRCDDTGEVMGLAEWARAIAAKTGTSAKGVGQQLGFKTRFGTGRYLGLKFTRVSGAKYPYNAPRTDQK